MRRLAAFLVLTTLISFAWPPLVTLPGPHQSCRCGCVANGRTCRCCSASKPLVPGGPLIQLLIQDGARRCPCTAVNRQLPGLKIHAIPKDRLLLAVPSREGALASPAENALPDGTPLLERERAPPA